MFNFTDVIQQFSGTPRESQSNAIKSICDIFNDNKKYAIAEIPTGVGKSHIAAAFCNSTKKISQDYFDLIDSNEAFRKNHDGTYVHEDHINRLPEHGGIVLTTTKSLQNQYGDLFENSELLKGKNNYQCNVDGSFTTEFAPCHLSTKLKDECISKKVCSFYNRRSSTLTSQFAVLNYSMFLSLPPFLRRRQILICDEATEIEETIISKFSADISYSSLESDSIPYKKLTSDNPEIARKWLTDLCISTTKMVNELLSTISLKNKKLAPTLQRDIKKLNKLTSFQESINSVLSSWHLSEYIVEKKAHSVIFTPYNVDILAQSIFGAASKVILMSAFIPKKTIEFLGIKASDSGRFEVNSPFNPKKSPIYCSTKYALSYSTLEKFLPKVIDQALTICDGYNSEKGIVHTHSMQITEAFQSKAKKNNRFLFREHGKNNEDIIKKHQELDTTPTVVVSPSLAFGVSFDDDLGRFQIIIKAPYMPLNSKRIKLLFERDPSYYQTKMLINLIQMCGRCTRNNEDFSATFILDATICKALHKEVDKLPKYFLDRFV